MIRTFEGPLWLSDIESNQDDFGSFCSKGSACKDMRGCNEKLGHLSSLQVKRDEHIATVKK